MATYISQYPPAQSDTYVKATTKCSDSWWPYFATDPTLSLTGGSTDVSWTAVSNTVTNQRFHIDLGSNKVIIRIYYENSHSFGGATDWGVKNFTFWGSNTKTSFDDLTYVNNAGWTELPTLQSTFDVHIAVNQVDPKYITVTNSTAYRYYAFKFEDNYGNTSFFGIRRIDLQSLYVAGYFSGYIYEQQTPVSRKVYLYERSTGDLVATTTSSGNGYYYMETTYSGSHNIVCLDDDAGVNYNDVIRGNVFPTTLSG